MIIERAAWFWPPGSSSDRRLDESLHVADNPVIMPDRRKHRGKHPLDEWLFAADRLHALRTAVAEYAWLLTHGYAVDSSLKLVGDRHNLTARQRLAVRRSACSEQALAHRRSTLVSIESLAGRRIAVDGYNLLITIESALSGGAVFIGRDGCYRDLAGIHGTYRKIRETEPAVSLIIDFLLAHGVVDVEWYLDRPVSNSGRLKTIIVRIVDSVRYERAPAINWQIKLVNSPDASLRESPFPVATTDAAVLDRCTVWINLAADLIEAEIPSAWRLDLRSS